VIPGATVTLVNEATGDARTAITNDRGEFTFRAVQPAPTRWPPNWPAFESTSAATTCSTQRPARDRALKLEIGTVSEVVTVTSQGTVVETKNSGFSGVS